MIAAITGFITTYYVTMKWIRLAKRVGLVGKDMNKPNEVMVPEAGGVGFVMGSALAISLMIGIEVFVLGVRNYTVYLLASLSVLLMAAFVGFIDDILGWKKGLSHKAKVLSTIPIAIPLMAVKAGTSVMNIPFIGPIDFGIFYSLVIVPIGVVGASNAFNILAGLNGLEASMAIIIFSTLAIVAFHHGAMLACALSIILTASAIAFLLWNKYPAKVFPGDVFTYSVGAMVATIAILGNLEGAALILYAPYFLEFALYVRGKLNGIEKECWGKPVNGCLEPLYDKIYSVTHLLMVVLKKIKGCATEKDVVILLDVIEIAIALVVIYIYVIAWH